MMEIELVTIEGNIQCILLDELLYQGTKYLFLINANNEKDYIIRKESGQELIGLDNESEFNNIMNLFLKKKLKENSNGD